MLDSNLVNITDFVISRLMHFTPTASKLWMLFSFCQTSLIFLMHLINHLVGPLVPLLSLQRSADCLEMVGFTTFSTFLHICRALLGCMSCSTILANVIVHGLIFPFLSILPDDIKFFSFLNTVQHNPFGPLCLKSSCPIPHWWFSQCPLTLLSPSISQSCPCHWVHLQTVLPVAYHTLYICNWPLFSWSADPLLARLIVFPL